MPPPSRLVTHGSATEGPARPQAFGGNPTSDRSLCAPRAKGSVYPSPPSPLPPRANRAATLRWQRGMIPGNFPSGVPVARVTRRRGDPNPRSQAPVVHEASQGVMGASSDEPEDARSLKVFLSIAGGRAQCGGIDAGLDAGLDPHRPPQGLGALSLEAYEW